MHPPNREMWYDILHHLAYSPSLPYLNSMITLDSKWIAISDKAPQLVTPESRTFCDLLFLEGIYLFTALHYLRSC